MMSYGASKGKKYGTKINERLLEQTYGQPKDQQ